MLKIVEVCLNKKDKMIKKSPLKSKINLLVEIFGLSKNDMQVLEICVFYKVFKDFNCLFSLINKRFKDSYNLQLPTIAVLSQLSDVEVSESLKKLQKLGFLDNYNDICHSALTLFLNHGIKSKSGILDCFLSKPLLPSLKMDDFNHMKVEASDILEIIKTAANSQIKGINILFWGGAGTGKTEFTKTITKNAGLKLYDVAFQMNDRELTREERIADLVRKQAILKDSKNTCFLFDEAEDVMCSHFLNRIPKAYMNRLLENNTAPIFWTTNDISNIDKAFLRRMTYAVEFKELSDESRLNIWKKELKKNDLQIDEKKLIELNNSYNIPPALITNAINTIKMTNGSQNDFEKCIKSIAVLINDGKNIRKNPVNVCENYNIGLINANLNIENLTEKIVQKGKLNFSLCLYGQSGTGKSAYARYLAKQIGIKVLLKRASDLMSPYVGQTEINIAQAFEEVT